MLEILSADRGLSRAKEEYKVVAVSGEDVPGIVPLSHFVVTWREKLLLIQNVPHLGRHFG